MDVAAELTVSGKEMDVNGYPTDKELKTIETWFPDEKPIIELLEYLEELWWCSEWGYKLTGKRILKLELHTGGWSGNESIIEALEKNFTFWSMYWQKTIRGGHYYFRIPLTNHSTRR